MAKSDATDDSMTGGIAAEFHARLAALETSNEELRAELEAAKSAGNVQPYDGFGEHVVHVMKKHFFHDKPDAA